MQTNLKVMDCWAVYNGQYSSDIIVRIKPTFIVALHFFENTTEKILYSIQTLTVEYNQVSFGIQLKLKK
ncbi:MAG: hypothetical protein JST20_00780 [Bacteroidetes bacterium]|nr:hypothetical protein [Bacteroidota bacterium]